MNKFKNKSVCKDIDGHGYIDSFWNSIYLYILWQEQYNTRPKEIKTLCKGLKI